MESRFPHVKGQLWGRKVAGSGHARTCPAVDKLKPTQQGAERVGYRCWLWYTRRECTLAQPGEYDWMVHVWRWCGFMSNYFDHLWFLVISRYLLCSVHCDFDCLCVYSVVVAVCPSKLECGPMPNLMVALPNTGGALYPTPQNLADAHY